MFLNFSGAAFLSRAKVLVKHKELLNGGITISGGKLFE